MPNPRKAQTCRTCGVTFDPPSPLGRPPAFCGPACRTEGRSLAVARRRGQLDVPPARPEEPTVP